MRTVGATLLAVASDPVPAESGSELKDRIDAERRGEPFMVYRDGEGGQVIRALRDDQGRLSVGRSGSADVALGFDSGVSGVHAELERIAEDWILVDDGLSRNGTFVNGERVVGRRRLRDGDALRFGSTVVVFRAPAASEERTATARGTPDARDVSEAQRRVLVALCRPFREGGEFAAPASNSQIAGELVLTQDTVKAHLRALFETFEVGDLPQNRKRIRLAELAIKSGVISPRDLEG